MEKLAETSKAIKSDGGRAWSYPCDISDLDACDSLIDKIVQDHGRIDILVNNAGLNTNPRSVAEVDPADWDRTIAVNLSGAFNCVRAVLPGMRRQKDGLIINVASVAGLRASKLAGAAYSASKHGMVSLNHSINDEEKENGIRACAICPGEVATPILDLRPEPVSAPRRAQMRQPEAVSAAALFAARVPPRACVPELVISPSYQMFR